MNLLSDENQIKTAINEDVNFLAYINGPKTSCKYSIEVDKVIFQIYYNIENHYEVYIPQMSINNIKGREQIVRLFAKRLQNVCNSL